MIKLLRVTYHFRKVLSFLFYQIEVLSTVEINFEAQDGAAPAWDDTSTNQNLINFPVTVNALLDRSKLINEYLTFLNNDSMLIFL